MSSGRFVGRATPWWLVGSFVSAVLSTAVFAQDVASNTDGRRAARETAAMLARPVSLHLEHASLKRTIDTLGALSNVRIAYSLDVLDVYPSLVNISVEHVALGVVLEHVLSGTRLHVVGLANGRLAIAEREDSSVVQNGDGNVTGRVVDSTTGRGLMGATIKIAGMKRSGVTTDSGRFVLRGIPAGDRTLIVKLFGYRPSESHVTVHEGEETAIRISLAAVPNVLSDVVTTATGLQQRLRVGNDITIINADSVLRVSPVTNVTQLLENRVPGLVVQHTTGIPGAPSRLRLRGESSLYMSDDPIIIVDGIRVYADQSGSRSATNDGSVPTGGGNSIRSVGTNASGSSNGNFAGPSALDQIDVNSIEKIEVLKGPSASALYGSDAANGVIVITTKRGHSGPPHWTMTTNVGRVMAPGSWPVNWYTFGSPYDGGLSVPCDRIYIYEGVCKLDSVVAFQGLNDPMTSVFKKWGQRADANVGVSGGNSQLAYYLSGTTSQTTGYLHLPDLIAQQFTETHGFSPPIWITDPLKYSSWGANSKTDVQLGQSGATLSLTSTIFHSVQQQTSLEAVVGNLGTKYLSPVTISDASFLDNFYDRAILETSTNTNAVSLNQWRPWHSAPAIQAVLGLNSSSSDNNSILPRDYVLGATDSLGGYAMNVGKQITQTLTLGTTLPTRLLSTAIGVNAYRNASSTLGAEIQGVALPIGVLNPSFRVGSGLNASNSSYAQTTYGWYVEPTLNVSSRFFVIPGVRFDGGSNSGSSKQSGFNLASFPKLSFSYLAVDPSHPRLGVITILRPRLSFGVAGVPPLPGQSLRLVQNVDGITSLLDSSGNGEIVEASVISSLGNTHLEPERKSELEGGFDITLGDDRVSLSLTAVRNTRYKAIEEITLAPSISTASPFFSGGSLNAQQIAMNIGTIRNTGTEAHLDARLVTLAPFEWDVSTNLTHNRNVVVSLAPGIPFISDPNSPSRIVPGYPINGVWERPILSYADVNGDGLIEPAEIRVADSSVYLGAPYPNYEVALSTRMYFFSRTFSVNTSASYSFGLTQINGQFTNIAWNNPQSSLAEQAAVAGLLLENGNRTSYGLVQTVNTLRWDDLSLNVNLPHHWMKHLHTSSALVSLQGSNLALHTNYRGKDPNVNAYTNGNNVADRGQLPQPRTWTIHLELGF